VNGYCVGYLPMRDATFGNAHLFGKRNTAPEEGHNFSNISDGSAHKMSFKIQNVV
jgi:hypothetical protein